MVYVVIDVSVTGPTWAADLAPIIYRECVGCHREGGVGPFPLETYEQAADVAAALAGETADRHMPPMPVDGSGTCNTYANARWLTEQEIDLFRAWYDAETPLGDPTLAPALPAPPAALEAPDLTLDPEVRIGGVHCPAVRVDVSLDFIECRVPDDILDRPETYRVTVRTPFGEAAEGLSLLVVSPPAIAALTPEALPAKGPDALVVVRFSGSEPDSARMRRIDRGGMKPVRRRCPGQQIVDGLPNLPIADALPADDADVVTDG